MTPTATPTEGATPTQLRNHHERQDRLRRLGMIPPPQPLQKAQEPAPAPEAPPEAEMAPVAAAEPEESADGPTPSWQELMRGVCDRHGVTRAMLAGTNRQRDVVRARHELFYLLYTVRGMSLAQVGRLVGDFDHTTVLHGMKQHVARSNGEVPPWNSHSTWTPERRATARSMRQSGATLQEIAEFMGLSREGVGAAFRRWRAEAVTIRARMAGRTERIAKWAEETRAA